MRSKHTIAAIILLGLSSQIVAAEINTRIGGTMSSINLIGEIDKDTPGKIAAAVKRIRATMKGTIFLRLDSGGGDVEAAIAAGIIAREHEMFTIVPEEVTCASACALTFLGGVMRRVAGQYGIHRPFAIRYTDSDAEARRSYEAINKLTASYLTQMNITSRVLDAMNVISPGDIRWLTKSERKDLGIEATDPVFDDRTNSGYARRLGITKRELYERQQRAERLSLGSRPGMSMEEKARCYQDVVEGRLR